MSEFYGEEDYGEDYEEAPRPQNAEQDVVSEYFPSSNGQVNYTDDEYLLDDGEEEGYEEEPREGLYAPADPALAPEGLDYLSRLALQEKLGRFAEPLAALEQARREDAAAHEAWQAEQQEQAEDRAHQEIVGVISNFEQQNGRLSVDHEQVMGYADQIFDSMVREGYENTPETALGAVWAACEWARNDAIKQFALRKV